MSSGREKQSLTQWCHTEHACNMYHDKSHDGVVSSLGSEHVEPCVWHRPITSMWPGQAALHLKQASLQKY